VVDLDQSEDGSPYLAMEYVEGPDLRHALEGGPFAVQRALAIARGIALGLGAAHETGVVHRDVKPENILLAGAGGPSETPKLLDFGIAAMKESTTIVSRTHGLMLTPPYAAPEQWKGMSAEEIDARTDLYALGGVLYLMLTGKTAFHASNSDGWMYQHLQEQPLPPSLVRLELSYWLGLDALVLRLLAKDREQRPSGVPELVWMIDAVRYASPGAGRKAETDDGASRVSPEHAGTSSKPPRSRGIGIGLLGLLGPGLILAALAVWLTSPRPSPPTNPPGQTPPVAQQKTGTNGGNTPQPSGLTPEPRDRASKGIVPVDSTSAEQQAEALFKQKHYSDARPLFEQACSEGQMRACNYLGYLYAQGIGGLKDVGKAHALYQKACEQGTLSSCASLGSLYQDAGDNDDARKYFQKACSGGVAEACDLLRDAQ
jgi:serine/threonine protein kinase